MIHTNGHVRISKAAKSSVIERVCVPIYKTESSSNPPKSQIWLAAPVYKRILVADKPAGHHRIISAASPNEIEVFGHCDSPADLLVCVLFGNLLNGV